MVMEVRGLQWQNYFVKRISRLVIFIESLVSILASQQHKERDGHFEINLQPKT